jgi:hypothetical protein
MAVITAGRGREGQTRDAMESAGCGLAGSSRGRCVQRNFRRPELTCCVMKDRGANFVAAWAAVLKEFGVPLKVLSVFYREVRSNTQSTPSRDCCFDLCL